MPSTAIYSRTDGVVQWYTCIERAGEQRENIEVRGSHSGLGWNPAVLMAIADRLAQPEGTWRPFRPPFGSWHLFPRPDVYRPPDAVPQRPDRAQRAGLLASTRLRSWRWATDSVVRSNVPPERISPKTRPTRSMLRSLKTTHSFTSCSIGAEHVAAAQHLVEQLAQGGQQVVAEPGPGVGLPAVVAGQRPDAVPQEVQVELAEQLPVGGGRLVGRAAAGVGRPR